MLELVSVRTNTVEYVIAKPDYMKRRLPNKGHDLVIINTKSARWKNGETVLDIVIRAIDNSSLQPAKYSVRHRYELETLYKACGIEFGESLIGGKFHALVVWDNDDFLKLRNIREIRS